MTKINGETDMASLQSRDINNVIKHWEFISSYVHEPQNKDDYKVLAALLDKLLDVVGEDESHPVMGLIDHISYILNKYDEAHSYQTNKISGVDALKFLMEQHDLKQSDLSDIGSQGVVSEILNGKRQLNLNQVKKLATRFNVSVATFIE